jgi:Na+/proline symporter
MMNINIDSAIFIGFLVVNIIFGLSSSRGIKTITEYAVGDRNFTTATIVSTIVATWISGEYFFTIASEAYNSGLYFIWGATISDLVCFLLIAFFFANYQLQMLWVVYMVIRLE